MTIEVILPDGNKRELPDGSTAMDLAKAISPRLADVVVVAKVDGSVVDVRTQLKSGQRVELLKADSPEGRDTLHHSAEHILATAVCTLFPGAQVSMGPSSHAEEFYYDFDVGRSFNPDDLVNIEAEMHKLIAAKTVFHHRTLDKAAAGALFAGLKQRFKPEILSWIPDDEVSIYESGSFTDLCRGPHLPHAGFIQSLKLLTVSSAYWRGDSKRDPLQRITGVAFPKKEELDKYLFRVEEAKKRDHRKLGRELELFLVSEKYDDHDYDTTGPLEIYVSGAISEELESNNADQWLTLAAVERVRALTGRKVELKRPDIKVDAELEKRSAALEEHHRGCWTMRMECAAP
jgi:threonyl-tRNA synthetase